MLSKRIRSTADKGERKKAETSPTPSPPGLRGGDFGVAVCLSA